MTTTDGIKFLDAAKNQNGATAARRDAAKLMVSRTGAMRGNTEGKQMFAEYIRKMGGDPQNYQLTYKGSEESGLVGLYLSKQGDCGVMNVRIYENSISFHAGGCFEEFPKLRPAETVDCHISPLKDAAGIPCLAIHVTAGSPRHSVKRTNKQSQAAVERAAVSDQGA